jgi:hypothetical protein
MWTRGEGKIKRYSELNDIKLRDTLDIVSMTGHSSGKNLSQDTVPKSAPLLLEWWKTIWTLWVTREGYTTPLVRHYELHYRLFYEFWRMSLNCLGKCWHNCFRARVQRCFSCQFVYFQVLVFELSAIAQL